MTFQSHCLTIIRTLAQERSEFTSDDIYERLEQDPHDPNQIGAAFREAAKRGLIKATGRITRSKRAAAKGRNIQIWERSVGPSLFDMDDALGQGRR